jgi:hypothetical protein
MCSLGSTEQVTAYAKSGRRRRSTGMSSHYRSGEAAPDQTQTGSDYPEAAEQGTSIQEDET